MNSNLLIGQEIIKITSKTERRSRYSELTEHSLNKNEMVN